ncbi:hypothetical protein WR164_13190 [Philodulcilactobacillus myokoensis]|uniref:NlpC/P60 domain-containing protein n=1 Tax=Philodulcilactobacillus myokoensis TaxID=2929573 RepID=A0A9W6B319_9LACO|nr:NlpC/P60 family protein [Philodulcilactobacillus myokoensis]GLB47340.1 hypothetical protein WR164_13190 [Philodulcilactobacillus myokoensis]
MRKKIFLMSTVSLGILLFSGAALYEAQSKSTTANTNVKTHRVVKKHAKQSTKESKKKFQNPKRYYQVQYQQIKPDGKIGYTVKPGFEGIKTYKIMKRLGTYNGYNKYNSTTYNAVKNFQRRHHLKATGDVDQKTWNKLGLKPSQFKSIDSYVAPTTKAKTRWGHIEAMIKQAYRYKGNPYLVGSSSNPSYGTDCSGLVMQSLYAGGINPAPISSIHHAYPGNEWNSRNLFASKKFKHVSYAKKRRGDLIFYYQPGTSTIWHVAIYLGHNKVIESWPPKTMVSPIRDAQRSDIAGVARPFVD